ncbi:MAG: hypothetical protein U1E68_02960 [Sphingomonadaceae bacterium]
MSEFREIGRHLKEAAGAVATKSVINPMLWLAAIVAVPAFAASVLSEEPYKFYFFALGALVAGVPLISYVFFAFTDPDRLQDEEFRLRDKALTIFGDSSPGDGIEKIIHGHAVTPTMIEHELKRVSGRRSGNE